MKRFTQLICLLLVMSIILVTPASAMEGTAWGSNYFHSRLAYLHPTTGTAFRIWIEVEAVGMMDKLGASEIILQRSSDNSTWTDVKTYSKTVYQNLVKSNAYHYETYVTYTGTSGNYYRAKVWFYAERDNGTAEYSYTTESIYVS